MKKNLSMLFTVLVAYFSQAQVGINTTTPAPSSAIDMKSQAGNPRGFLPSRINLQSQTDGTTIANPATGLIVYNTNGSAIGLKEGLTLNTGTSSSPLWKSFAPDTGVKIGKMVYFGTTVDNTKILNIGGFEFTYNVSGNNLLMARLAQPPTSTITLTGNRLGWVGGVGMTFVNLTWGPSDWNVWKQVDFMADGASHYFYLNVSNSSLLYKVSSFVTRDSFNSLVVEVY